MAKNSAIEWTGHTWNPWRGCHKVSQGCKYCYMFREQKRYGRDPNIVVRSKTTFNDPLKWTEPDLVFTCSWSDWFIEEADEWRSEAWEIIRQTQHLTYQILTKRPENIRDRLPEDWGDGWENVWLGVSVEDQEAARERIPKLTQIPARIRFLSCEPLLEYLDLSEWLGLMWQSSNVIYTQTGAIHNKFSGWRKSYKINDPDEKPIPSEIDWVIAGGESGSKARPMHPDWVKQIRDQCQAANISFFFKQWGEWYPVVSQYDDDDLTFKLDEYAYSHIVCIGNDRRLFNESKNMEEMYWCGYQPDPKVNPWFMAKIGKKDAGAVLDGSEWREFPHE